MTKSKKRQPRPKRPKRTLLGIELEDSAREILAHLKGEIELPVRRVPLPDTVDVRRNGNRGENPMQPAGLT